MSQNKIPIHPVVHGARQQAERPLPLMVQYSSEQRHVCSLKRHSTLQVTLVEEGEITYHVGSRRLNGSPGDVFLIRPFDLHFSVSRHGQPYRLKLVEFERSVIVPDYLLATDDRFDFLRYPTVNINNRVPARSKAARTIANIMAGMPVAEKKHSDAVCLLRTVSSIQLILAELAVHYCACCSLPQKSRPRWRVMEKVLGHLDENYLRKIPLDELSRVACLQKNYLCRMFKEFTGMPVSQYVIRKRLAHAVFLLNTSDMPVTHVAFESGFENLGYFYRCFKKHLKVAPSFFRGTGG